MYSTIMNRCILSVCLLTLALIGNIIADVVMADEEVAGNAPFLRVEASGPLAYVTSLAFRSDPVNHKVVLHAAGWDKTVHSWNLSDGQGKWNYDPLGALRVPIGPANFGSANAMAISADGRWVAVGGRAVVRDWSQERENGLVWLGSTALTEDMLLDMGTIFAFHLPTGKVHRLRGHAGSVLSLTFAPGPDPILISAAVEQPPGTVPDGKIRIWDLAEQRELKVLQNMPKNERVVRPGLAAWRIGPAKEAIRVGIAWRSDNLKNDRFRVWDVASNQLSQKPNDQEPKGPFPAALCFLSGQTPRLFTGVLGEIGIWTIPKEPIDQLAYSRHYRRLMKLEPQNGQAQALIATAAIPAQTTQGELVAAVIFSSAYQSYRLIVLSSDSGKQLFETPLWQGTSKVPVITADAEGKYLAISGNDQHEVWVFRLQDVVAGKNEKQVLRSESQSLNYVAFATRENRRGIVFGQAPVPSRSVNRPWQTDDRVFDISQRRLVDTQGWKVDNANHADWNVELRRDVGHVRLSVARGQSSPKTIELDQGDSLETWAGCPATEVVDEPLLAASIKNAYSGESQLWLFNPETGIKLRRLNGHIDQITSLAFSRDGKFLVSASIDHTFRIWGLSDLKDSLQANAGLSGLEVSMNANGQLTVVSDRLNRLPSGSSLTIVEAKPSEGNPSFRTPTEFYRYVSEKKPGDRVVVEFTDRDATKKGRTELVLERCIDERKPLSSVFLFSARQGDSTNWICWDPLGRYDSSQAESEGRLGWHFNTNDEGSPVRFAPAERYREQNYWKGLIADHLEQGAELKPRPRPEPQVSLLLHDEKNVLKTVQDKPVVVRSEPLSALLQIEEFPERLIDRVSWKVDDEEKQFTSRATGLWEARVLPLKHDRSVSTLVAAVTTRETPQRTVFRKVAFQLIPRAPTIVVEPGFPDVAQQEAISFSVSVQSDVFDQNESVEVSLQHRQGEQTVDVQKWLTKDSNPVPRQVTLRPGQNVLTVTARHTNATQESKTLEEFQRTFVIRLSEAQRPEIQLQGVIAKAGREPVAINPGVPWETSLRSIDIQGKVSVNPPDKLTQANFSIASGPEVALTGFKADSTFQFLQTIPISQPGRQTVTISTMSNRGVTDRVSFEVFFKPALPELSQLNLASGELAIPADRVIIEGRDDPEIKINAKFVPPTSDSLFPHQAQGVLRLRSGESTEEKVIDFPVGDQTTIREQIRLQRGENRVELFIQNEWGKKSLMSEVLIYRQPPRIVRTDFPKNSKTPEATFEAEITSVLPLTGVRVFRNGFDFSPEKLAINNIPQKADLWSVSFSVPLELDGKRTNVDFGVENADGECLRRVSSDATYRQPPPPIADIRPAFGKTISTKDPNLNIQFRVRSESPLQEIRINFKGDSARSTTIPIDDLPKPGVDGYFTLSHSMSLEQFDERTFKFFVEVKNAGGISRTKTTEVNYLPEPIPLVVDELRPAGGAPLRPVGYRTLLFPAVDVAKLELKGHLDAFKPRPDSEKSKEIRVKIWVNGFLQTSVPVEDHGKFSAKIVLNLENANRISFEVPNEPIDEVCLPKLVIDCKAHQRPANLRLITAIATDEKRVQNPDDSAQKLQDRILATMQIENSPIKGFKVALTTILEGDEFTDNSFEGHLRLMKGMMNRLDDEPTNDVILIYYQGKEIQREHGDFELTTGIPDMNVKRRKLVGLLSDIPGAHLLLLDVERSNPGAREQAWTDKHLGLLRVAWAGQLDLNNGPLRLVDALERNVGTNQARQNKPLLLVNVASMLDRTYQDIRNRFPQVLFDSEIPEDLERLALTP